MTSIGTLRELEDAVEEALAQPPSCEWEGDGWIECGQPANWLMRNTPCGHDDFFCTPCRADAMAYEDLDCDCGADIQASEIRWEPIR